MNRFLIMLSSVLLTVITFSSTSTASPTELAGAALNQQAPSAEQGGRGSSRISIAPSRLLALDLTTF